jgi:hypothetical protein
MSYLAEHLMRQNMSPEEYDRNVNGPAPQADPVVEAAAPQPIAEAAAAPEPPTPTLAPDQKANIEKERDRFARAGYDETTTSRLLGGPRQKLGA